MEIVIGTTPSSSFKSKMNKNRRNKFQWRFGKREERRKEVKKKTIPRMITGESIRAPKIAQVSE